MEEVCLAAKFQDEIEIEFDSQYTYENENEIEIEIEIINKNLEEIEMKKETKCVSTFTGAEKLAKVRKEYAETMQRVIDNYNMGFYRVSDLRVISMDAEAQLNEKEAEIFSDYSEKECIEVNAISDYIEVKNFGK